jgi:hypothetical protein
MNNIKKLLCLMDVILYLLIYTAQSWYGSLCHYETTNARSSLSLCETTILNFSGDVLAIIQFYKNAAALTYINWHSFIKENA